MILSTQDAPLVAQVARQEPHVVTQTLTRQATTLVTRVTLGSTGTAAPTGLVVPDADIEGNGHGLSSAQLGAILGSIAAVVVLIIVAGICFANKKKPRTAVYQGYGSSYGTSSTSDSLPSRSRPKKPRYPPRVVELIPGGSPYPTYRAIPIQNPRNPPPMKRVYV